MYTGINAQLSAYVLPVKYMNADRGDCTMENPNNRIVAVGRFEGGLEMSHEVMNEPFYTATLLVKRLSGAYDRLPVTVPGKLLTSDTLPEDRLMMVHGQVRSYNKVVEGSGRLMVTLFAQSITECDENETLNKVTITGALCRPPVYRSTPFGREICDMMLAVGRAFGKSDYIPCIAWGRNAQYASRFNVGDRLKITGRLQSREYQKLTENGEYIQRMAYEISAFTLEVDDGIETRREFTPTIHAFMEEPVDEKTADIVNEPIII